LESAKSVGLVSFDPSIPNAVSLSELEAILRLGVVHADEAVRLNALRFICMFVRFSPSLTYATVHSDQKMTYPTWRFRSFGHSSKQT
jgi:hypothetical protein